MARMSWTPDLDAALRRGRRAGRTWAAIAATLGVSESGAYSRGRQLSLPGNRWQLAAPGPAAAEAEVLVLDRPPFAPGHPASWGAITAGTCLEGMAYPSP